MPMTKQTFADVAAAAAQKGFELRKSDMVFYLMFDKGKKAAVNPNSLLPMFYSLEDAEEYLNSPDSESPTNRMSAPGYIADALKKK
jgi:hypothetical protein